MEILLHHFNRLSWEKDIEHYDDGHLKAMCKIKFQIGMSLYIL